MPGSGPVQGQQSQGCCLRCGEGFQPTPQGGHGWGQPLPRGAALRWGPCVEPQPSSSLALLTQTHSRRPHLTLTMPTQVPKQTEAAASPPGQLCSWLGAVA